MFTHFDQQFFEDLTFVEYFEKYGFDKKKYTLLVRNLENIILVS
jgi:hypothetical protein